MIKKTDILTFSKLFILEDGKPIQLEDWQVDNILKPVFYDLDDNGIRRYNLSLNGLPQKNGKSTLASLIATFMLLSSGESEPEVYGCAGGKDQIYRTTNGIATGIDRIDLIVIPGTRRQPRQGDTVSCDQCYIVHC